MTMTPGITLWIPAAKEVRKLLDCACATVKVVLVTVCEAYTTALVMPAMEVGGTVVDSAVGVRTVGVETGGSAVVGASTAAEGSAEGAKVGTVVGALEGTSTKGACTVAPGMVAARLVDTALTVAGSAKRASMDDVLPADADVTTLYATCTPTTVACNNSLLLLLDSVTVPSDQNSFTDVMVTLLPAGNTFRIEAVKALWNAGVFAFTPKMVCRTKTGRFVGREVGCCNRIENKGK